MQKKQKMPFGAHQTISAKKSTSPLLHPNTNQIKKPSLKNKLTQTHKLRIAINDFQKLP